MNYVLNIGKFKSDPTVSGIVRLLSIFLEERSYMTMEQIFKEMCDHDLRMLADSFYDNPSLQLTYFTLICSTAEGNNSISEETFEKQINICYTYICLELLKRKKFVEIDMSKATFNETDMTNLTYNITELGRDYFIKNQDKLKNFLKTPKED